MYYRGSFFFRALAALMLVGFLVLGAALIFQAGRATGFSLGVASGGSDVLLPGAQPFGMYPGGPFMLFLGFVCLAGLAFPFFFAMMGIFGRKRWKAHGMHGHPKEWDEAYAARWGTPPWWREPKPEDTPPGGKEAADDVQVDPES